jgi:hypothetical protein
MTDIPSPIDLALKAIGELFSSPLTFKAYTDDSPYSLNQLPKSLAAAEVPVLIRMGTKAAKNQEPYAKVLGQFLQEKVGVPEQQDENQSHPTLGISDSVHSIVSGLLRYKVPENKGDFLENLGQFKSEVQRCYTGIEKNTS